MTIEIKIPSDQPELAAAIGQALVNWGTPKGHTTTVNVDVCLNKVNEVKNAAEELASIETPEATEAVEAAEEAPPTEDQGVSVDEITEAEVNAGTLVELDKDGIPWDNRIHSRTKSKVKAGTWKIKRKPADQTDEEWDAFVESVKQELLDVQAIEVVDVDEALEPPVEDAEEVPPVEEVEEVEEVPPVEDVEEVPPVEDIVIKPDAPKTFPELMKFITSNNKALNADTVNKVLAGIDPKLKIPHIAQRLDLIPTIHAKLEALL